MLKAPLSLLNINGCVWKILKSYNSKVTCILLLKWDVFDLFFPFWSVQSSCNYAMLYLDGQREVFSKIVVGFQNFGYDFCGVWGDV